MLANRSMPRSTVIPELGYQDIGAAIAWLADAFGLTLRLRIGDHRAQLNVGDGAVVLTRRPADAGTTPAAQSLLIRVTDVDRHHARASRHGARVVQPPTDYPYGERQYTVADPGGHHWTFSQSIADIDPVAWGGTPGQL